MPRPRKLDVVLRGAPALADMPAMSTADLTAVAIGAPGDVVTSDSPLPWHATPRHCVTASGILRQRESEG
ncbi:hypothetical protein BH23GEM6_BH23GEM6_04400 [soil metagenome]